MISQNISTADIKDHIGDITFPSGGGFLLDATKEYPIAINPIKPDIAMLSSLSIRKNDVG